MAASADSKAHLEVTDFDLGEAGAQQADWLGAAVLACLWRAPMHCAKEPEHFFQHCGCSLFEARESARKVFRQTMPKTMRWLGAGVLLNTSLLAARLARAHAGQVA